MNWSAESPDQREPGGPGHIVTPGSRLAGCATGTPKPSWPFPSRLLTEPHRPPNAARVTTDVLGACLREGSSVNLLVWICGRKSGKASQLAVC